MGRPSDDHEARRELLDAIAILAGFTLTFPGALPDGRRPDVLRVSLTRSGLFVGDAKATESPGNSDTVARLLAYARWIDAAARGRSHPVAVLAVCVPGRHATQGWTRALELVAHEAGLPLPLIEATALGSWGLVSCSCWFPIPEDHRCQGVRG